MVTINFKTGGKGWRWKKTHMMRRLRCFIHPKIRWAEHGTLFWSNEKSLATFLCIYSAPILIHWRRGIQCIFWQDFDLWRPRRIGHNHLVLFHLLLDLYTTNYQILAACLIDGGGACVWIVLKVGFWACLWYGNVCDMGMSASLLSCTFTVLHLFLPPSLPYHPIVTTVT